MVAVREIGRLREANAPASGPPCGAVDHAMGGPRHFPPPWSVEETDACFIHRAVRLFSGASPALHLQDVPQAVRHAWYATGGPHKRKQAKHNKQRKPASNRGTHHPLPPARRGPRNLTAPPKRSFVCDLKAVKPRDSRGNTRRPPERRQSCSLGTRARRVAANLARLPIPTQSFPQSREFTLPQYQSSGVSPSAPPHSIGTNRG